MDELKEKLMRAIGSDISVRDRGIIIGRVFETIDQEGYVVVKKEDSCYKTMCGDREKK